MNTKICTNCKEEKELSEFRIVKKKYYRGECKSCEAEYSKQKTNKKIKIINDYKKDGCVICGENRHPNVLDLHHIDPSKKDIFFNNKKGWSEKRLIEELEKCIVLCSNCHRLVHLNIINMDVSYNG